MIEKVRAYFTPAPESIGSLVLRMIAEGNPEISFMIDPEDTGDPCELKDRTIYPIQKVTTAPPLIVISGLLKDTETRAHLVIDTHQEPAIAEYTEYSD